MKISPIVLLFVVLICVSGTYPAQLSAESGGNQPVVARKPIKVVPNSPEAEAWIEDEIREGADKPTGKLTKADLEKVTRLDLNDNQITDVMPLAELTKLEKLYLHFNKITDVKDLAGLTKLETLYLHKNKITDLKPLAGLTKLYRLDLQDNPNLTKAEIGKLQKALPKCDITHDATK